MDLFKRGKVHNGTLVFSKPLSLPEGAEVIVRVIPVGNGDECTTADASEELTAVSIGQDETSEDEQEDLLSLPFFGMWADREDMQDSVAWVRRQRSGWNHRHKREA